LDNLSAGWYKFIHPKADFEHCDITKSETRIRDLFKGHGVEYVFNYAAQPYVPVSFERPLHVFELNALGAMQVINAAQEAGCKGILQVSSAEIFGGPDFKDVPPEVGCAAIDSKINEDFPVRPHSSYGAAKAAVDYFVQCRWREAKTPCLAIRHFNACGERETHPYVIPEICGQLSKQLHLLERNHHPWQGYPPFKKAEIYLGNNSFRDFIYAGDAVRMAAELLEKGQFGEVFNLGSESGIKIYDLAKLIGRLMGFEDVIIHQDQTRIRPWEIWHLQASNEKIYSVIDYRPQVSLEEALKRTIQWYEDNGRRWPWEARS
jgi:nucleoside-diphosphate-sugar epimerase